MGVIYECVKFLNIRFEFCVDLIVLDFELFCFIDFMEVYFVWFLLSDLECFVFE